MIAGDPGLGAEVERFRAELLVEKSGGPQIRAEVADMRARIAAAKPAQDDWDAKFGAGRLQDIELTAQMLALLAGSPARDTGAQIGAGVAMGLADAVQGNAMLAAAGLFWQVQAAARLLAGTTLVPQDIGEGGRRFVLRETGQTEMDAVRTAMQDAAGRAAIVIDHILGQAGQ